MERLLGIVGKRGGRRPDARPHGQCRLTKSGANLLLSPQDGNKLIINGSVMEIPSGGVTLGTGGTSADTTYYIYAYESGGAVTLEASTTTHATDTTNGVEIKSGDGTRTLVGLARSITGPAWQDTDGQRLTISYFNRRRIASHLSLSSDATVAVGTYTEVSTNLRHTFVTWSDEAVDFYVSGTVQNTTGTALTRTSMGIDDATAESVYSTMYTETVDVEYPVAIYMAQSGLAIGYHDFRVLGAVTAGTGTWNGGAAGLGTSSGIVIRG